MINPAFWHLRHSDDDLAPASSPSQIEMKFVFASFLDDDNFVKSNGVGKKLSVKVNPNPTGVSHFDAARQTRNAILSSLEIPHHDREGMGYGNEGTVHHAGGTMRMSGDDTGVVDTNLKFEAVRQSVLRRPVRLADDSRGESGVNVSRTDAAPVEAPAEPGLADRYAKAARSFASASGIFSYGFSASYSRITKP